MSAARLLLAGALFLLAACGAGDPPPHVDLAYRVEASRDAVETGRGFPIRIVRGWSKGLVPEAFDVRTLAPLTLHALGVERQEDDTHVQETLHYRAHAFTLRDVQLGGLVLRALPRDGGPLHEVVADPLDIVVRPTLPADAGAPELPGDPLPDPPSRWPLVAALVALLGLGGIFLRRVSRHPVAPAAPTLGAEEVARAALERIRARPSTAPDAVATDIAATADVLRDYVASRHAFDARRRTTEEVGDALGQGRPGGGTGLLEVLLDADLVKFAALAPTSGLRTAVLDRAFDYLRADASAERRS